MRRNGAVRASASASGGAGKILRAERPGHERHAEERPPQLVQLRFGLTVLVRPAGRLILIISQRTHVCCERQGGAS